MDAVQFENKPELPYCEKRWGLNRIYDTEEENKIIDYLDGKKAKYFRIPFSMEEYKECIKKKIKNSHVMLFEDDRKESKKNIIKYYTQ